MGDSVLVTIVLIVMVMNVALMVYGYIRVKDRRPLVRDQVIGFLLSGPLFFFIDRGLRKRNHKLTAFEYYGLLILALVVVVIVGAAVTNVSA